MEKLQAKTGMSTDEEIIQKILMGETALFEVLIRRYNSLLYKIARSYGLAHHDAEDVMQETHVAAYTKLGTFRREASYKTWLTQILLHHCYHKLNYGFGKYEKVNQDLGTENILQMQEPAKQNTERSVINKELAKVLEKSLQQLPLPYRSVFVLREIEGFSVAETAELLQITETNVKVRLNRAKAMLQKQLEQVYSSAEIFEFHLKYCDKIVQNVFNRITPNQS
jgi:RNA polymerase sigma-70 factor (ECF subfamily)